MKLRILSDLHHEYCEFEPPIGVDADVVVLAGDIAGAAYACHRAREWFPDCEIILVPGNHEFYRADRPSALAVMRTEAEKYGIHLLDNDEVVIGGPTGSVRFLGATLWTDFELDGGGDDKVWAMREGQHFLNDFRAIHEDAGRFTPARSIELHRESVAWLEAKLCEQFDGKTIVVTHHLPSKLSVAEQYKHSKLNPCFASHLDRLFGKADLWIHGHTHHSCDYVVGGTRVVCNPRGYQRYEKSENPEFDPALVIEV